MHIDEESTEKRVRTAHVMFSGGGTLGPVMPLIAVYEELRARHPKWRYTWVGAANGPERALVARAGIHFIALPPAKLRRYWTWQNIADAGVFIYAVYKSWRIVKKYKPDVLVTAGGFVSVPLHVAGKVAGVAELVHQQDVLPGLANRIMARWARFVTVSCERTLPYFKTRRKAWIGNPVRADLRVARMHDGLEHFGFSKHMKTVLVLGGGTGAERVNILVGAALPRLRGVCQIIHMTGYGKSGEAGDMTAARRTAPLDYRHVEFLDGHDLARAYAAADFVITRGGMSTLSELAVLGKPSLIIPIQNSHQEANAEFFAGRGGALVFDEARSADEFADTIKRMVSDEGELLMMGHEMKKIMPMGARAALADAIEELIARDENENALP